MLGLGVGTMTTLYATCTAATLQLGESAPAEGILFYMTATAAILLVCLALAFVYAVQAHSRVAPKHLSVTQLQALKVPSDDLFRLFQPHLVSLEEISARGYSSVLSLVQTLIGVQPTCDMVLEIWKPAFECYNIIVPNFLNLPQLLLPGYGIRDLVSLATYISSRANGCTYCTSHCCSFALRRGVDPALLRHALDALLGSSKGGETAFTPRERAVIRVAYGVGTVPACLQPQDVQDLQEKLTAAEVEWIVAATAMFGDFNKLMDGLAIPLEEDTYAETKQHLDERFVPSQSASVGLKASFDNLPVPPVDDWTLKLAVIYQGLRPGGALALDAKLTEGIPTSAEDCQAYLEELALGAGFAVLEKLQHERFRRALTAVLAKNFVSGGLSLRTKVRAGIQYCQILDNHPLQLELQGILFHLEDTQQNTDDLVLRAAKALSYSPSRMTAPLIDEIEASSLTAENAVELVSFLAAIQALHRIQVFFQVAEEI